MKSLEKIENYLEKFTRTKHFQDRVAKIRKTIGIPQDGIVFPDPPPKIYTIEFPASELGIHFQDQYYPTFTRRWSETIDHSCDEILADVPYPFKSHDVILFFNIYILYNERHYDVFNEETYRGTVSLIEIRQDFLEMKDVVDPGIVPDDKRYVDMTTKKYPVVIGISPFATQNEVIDFVKNRWEDIQKKIMDLVKYKNIPPYEEEKAYLATIRKRKPKAKEIEDIVYENKNLSLEQLCKLIKERTGVILDQGEIGKIRSLAIQRREKDGK